MGQDASHKCWVIDHAIPVYGYDCPVMLHMLKKNLFPPKGGI